jgi:pimeloyl-ACP methyl ester carboxylesterase
MAGAHWASAHGAELRYLAGPVIGALRSSAVFMSREDDVLYGCLDALPDPLPAGCRIERIPPESGAWRLRLLQLLREADLPDTRWSLPLSHGLAGRQGERQQYVDLVHGQVRVRMRGTPVTGQVPVLLINDVPGSPAAMDGLAEVLSQDRTTIAIDLPGLGESTALPYPSLGTYVSALSETLEQLQLSAVDVVAHGLGTAFAIALAAHRPAHVRRLVLDAVPLIRSRERGLVTRRYCPPIEPDRHGAYLQQIWHQLRDVEATWPWFDRSPSAARIRDPELDPGRLHAAFVDVMKQLPSYGDAARAALGAALRDILPGVKQPVLVMHDARDVRYGVTARVCRRLADVRQAPRPVAESDRAALVRDFLS